MCVPGEAAFACVSTAYENHTFVERCFAGKKIHVMLGDNVHAWNTNKRTTSDIQMEIWKSPSKE